MVMTRPAINSGSTDKRNSMPAPVRAASARFKALTCGSVNGVALATVTGFTRRATFHRLLIDVVDGLHIRIVPAFHQHEEHRHAPPARSYPETLC